MAQKRIARSFRPLLLAAAFFLLSVPQGSARSFFYFGGYNRNPLYFAPANAAGYRDYGAALTHPAATGAPATTAADYLSAVCKDGTYTWEADKLPIKVWIADGTGVPGYKPIFPSYIRRGFDEWAAASGGKLGWVEVKDANQADVTVRWTDQVTERPEGTEAGRTSALTRLNTSTGKGIIYGARMQFLTKLPNRYFSDDEVEKTCLHEAGHAFGLQGHSPYRNDIMFYAVSPNQQPQLTDRDRATMAKLYASYPTLDAMALKAKTNSSAAVTSR